MDVLKSKGSILFNKALQVYNDQHQAIAENVANINNPDYQKKKTDFSDVLRDTGASGRIKVSHEKHIQKPHFESTLMNSENAKDNEVDLTEEMTHLAENQIRHEFVTRLLNRYYSGISTSITGNIK